MGVQIPRRVHSQMPAKDVVSAVAARYLGEVFRKLAEQKESEIEEESLIPGSRPHDDIDPAEIAVFPG